VAGGDVRVSDHGWDWTESEQIAIRDVVAGVSSGKVIEDYPNYGKGPSVLLLQRDRDGAPIHVVRGIPKGHDAPAVIVTAYRPDPSRWDACFMSRQK
jgi:hypothetical protein